MLLSTSRIVLLYRGLNTPTMLKANVSCGYQLFEIGWLTACLIHGQYATFFFPSCEGVGCGEEHQGLYTLPVLPSVGDEGKGEVVVRTWTITSVHGNDGPLEITVQAKVRATPAVIYHSHGVGSLSRNHSVGCNTPSL